MPAASPSKNDINSDGWRFAPGSQASPSHLNSAQIWDIALNSGAEQFQQLPLPKDALKWVRVLLPRAP
jgi:hypothetical protein